MNRVIPILADERTAAQLFCMNPAEFRALVAAGHLPKPQIIGGHQRWPVEELQQIAKGERAQPGGGLEI